MAAIARSSCAQFFFWKSWKKTTGLAIYLAFALALTSCDAIVSHDQPHIAATLPISAGASLGQSFVAPYAGLEGIQIYLAPHIAGNGEVVLALYTGVGEHENLRQARMPLSEIHQAGFYRFNFPPLADSRRKSYFALVTIQREGSLQAGISPGEAYLNGTLYQDILPQEAQMAFHLVYDPLQALLGFMDEVLTWVGVTAAGVLLLIVPGWALLSVSLAGWKVLSGPERFGLSGGLSMAFYPLLFLWTDMVGLRMGSGYAWLPVSMGAVVLIWRAMRSWRANRAAWRWENLRSGVSTPDLLFWVVSVILLSSRLWAIRDLEAPMWGDSVQHAFLAQLLVDNQGLFESWKPYAPYTSLTVQFGFPSLAAGFAWLTGVNPVKATLLVGQLVNTLAVLAIYPLAIRIASGNRWVALLGICLAGFISPMPAYYVNWGRYAQLGGIAIFPAATWFLWSLLEKDRTRNTSGGDFDLEMLKNLAWDRIALAALVVGGMTLAYYRMPFFIGAFILAWLACLGASRWRGKPRMWLQGILSLALLALLAGLLISPWLPRMVGGNLAEAVEAGVRGGSPLEPVLEDYRIWFDLEYYLPQYLLWLAGLGMIASIALKRWQWTMLGVWVLVLASFGATALINVPGANMMQSFAVIITLYLPVSLVAGWVIYELVGLSRKVKAGMELVLLPVLVVALTAWGAWDQRHIPHLVDHVLVTRPDMRAFSWIRRNIAEEARFLVEGYLIKGGSTAVGSDAGWWIPLLARRENTMPPQYALLNEAPVESEYSQGVVDLVAALETTSPASKEGVQLLCDWGITHVYIGQRQGMVGSGATQLFTPAHFSGEPSFDLAYHQDRVWIFSLKPEACVTSQ